MNNELSGDVITNSFTKNENLKFVLEESNLNESEIKDQFYSSTEIHQPTKLNLARYLSDLESKKRANTNIGLRLNRNISMENKRKISIINGTPRTQEDLERLLDPMYVLKTTKIQKVNEFDYEIHEELNKTHTIGLSVNNNDKETRRYSTDDECVGKLEIKVFKSWFFTILSVINCIIRYTMIQLPYCIKVLGLLYGSFTVITVAAISLYSVYLLIKISEKTGENSYSQFGYKWFKLKGKILILILNILSSFGSCLSYVIIFLKFIPNLIASKLGNDSILADKVFLSVVLSILLIIYCYQNDVSGIKSAAYWGVLGISLLLCLVLYDLLWASKHGVLHDWSRLNVLELDEKPTNIISCISCIILSFSFHTYTFSIYECLSEKNTKSMLITTGIGLFVSMMIYLLFGCVGYILYVDQVDEYYILNREHDTVLNYLENIAFVVNVIMSFPLTFFSLRHYFTFLVQILLTLLVEKFECLKKFRHLSNENENYIFEGKSDQDDIDIKLENNIINEKKDSLKHFLKDESKKNSIVELSISNINFPDCLSEKYNERRISGVLKNCNIDTIGNVENKQKTQENIEIEQEKKEESNYSNEETENDQEHESDEIHHYVKLPKNFECLMNSGMFILIIFIGNHFQKMKIIFAFLGATTANIFSFILPAFFFLHFCYDISRWEKIPSVFMIILGICGLFVCVVSNIIDLNSHH